MSLFFAFSNMISICLLTERIAQRELTGS